MQAQDNTKKDQYFLCVHAGKYKQCKNCPHNKPHFFQLPRFNTENCSEKGICLKTGLFSVYCKVVYLTDSEFEELSK